jgi:DNA-binding transcriptional LysR family regulator
VPELRQLRYFLAVAEELNFTRAARRLHIAQQALSAAVRQLEAELGTRLFTRTTRKVELTHAGEALVEPARRVLADTEAAVAAVEAVARGERGHLHVGLLSGAAGELPHLVFAAFRERLPEASLDFHYYTWNDPSVGLRSGETHVAFALPPITGDFDLLPLSWEPRVAVLPADHPLARRRGLSIADLVDEVWCDLPSGDPVWRDFWLATAHRGGRPMKTGPVMTSFDEQAQYALAGAGISLSTESVGAQFRRAGLAFVPVRDIEPATAALAWRWGDENPLVARLVEVAADVRDGEAAAGRLRGARVAPPKARTRPAGPRPRHR